MKIGVYFCECGSIIAGKLDYPGIQRRIAGTVDVAYVKTFDLMCASEQLAALAEDLRSEKPDRVVIAACSPRDREDLFQRALEESGINPYLLQMVNIREQVVWVTKDPKQATIKAIALIKAAIARVRLHEPLEKKSIAVCPDVMVIGAGPAGLSAALTLAEAGRRVVLVEKSPAAGGMPTMFDELFPDRECGPCLMGPLLDTMLQGEYAGNIELLTLTQVTSLKGYFGNFTVTLEQRPRFVDSSL
jgi:heterodisulfide reductase subunit A2